ncbi:MAG: TM2 domain-containing protein [Acidobacteria bacterium]|nr:TM2 domain-containing protein [Acidobacteriota bacterium]
MHCRNCGKEIAGAAVFCVGCGSDPRSGNRFCWNCGAESQPVAQVCVQCGVSLAGQRTAEAGAKSRLAAGLLGILLGGLGIHRFYLGYNGIGIAQLALGLGGIFTCGITSLASWLWGLIEGIMILTGSIDKDAQGQRLRD